jgi:hypothetical protein
MVSADLVLVEKVPRAQSRAQVITADQGRGIIFTTRDRPRKGTRGFFRLTLRPSEPGATRHTIHARPHLPRRKIVRGANAPSYRACRRRVRAAFCPARRNPSLPFVRTAFIAALCKEERPRLLAAAFVCRESADFAALDVLSLCKAFSVARERLGDTLPLPERPLARSRSACLRTRFVERPGLGAPNLTPARRAFDKPIAIACCGDLAPCFPSRT